MPEEADPERNPIHFDWLASVSREIADDYNDLQKVARVDPQKAGHGGEGSWARFIRDWLPTGYGVGTRKYIVPEIGTDEFESDIVIFSRGYPDKLRDRSYVLSGGVAAAFSVKLTVDARGIRDAVDRAVRLRRATRAREGSPRSEMVGSFPVGLLAHSHRWKKPASKPKDRIERQLWDAEMESAAHPRELLDFLCVADLGMWTTQRHPYFPPGLSVGPIRSIGLNRGEQSVRTAKVQHATESLAPVAVLLYHLLRRLSYHDAALGPFTEGLRVTGTAGGGGFRARLWDADKVFSEQVCQKVPEGLTDGQDAEWGRAFGF